MTDAPELKPCPFCGQPAHVRDDTYHKTAVYISCGTLGCFGSDQWDETQSEAVAAWNTRADLAPSPDVVRGLVEAGNDILEAFCVLEDSAQIAAWEKLNSALAAYEKENRHD